MTVVQCYYCGCPVEFDPSGKLEKMGITLEELEKIDLAVICNVCTDMAEVSNGDKFYTLVINPTEDAA